MHCYPLLCFIFFREAFESSAVLAISRDMAVVEFLLPQSAPESEDEGHALLQQPFIKDPSQSIQDLINETVGKLGENIRVRRFKRYSLGE